jgi:hypothetical protein
MPKPKLINLRPFAVMSLPSRIGGHYGKLGACLSHPLSSSIQDDRPELKERNIQYEATSTTSV